MFEHLKALLASSDPATLIGSAAVAVFALIWSWRKLFPASWNWLELHIPWIDLIQSDALWTFTWKAVQALPGTLLGAVMTAIASGGDVKKTLLGALAGPVASIGHEVLKRYKGQPSKPSLRSLPPPALMLLLAICCAPSVTGCVPQGQALTAADVPHDVTLAYEGACVALEVTDTVLAAYLDSLQHPTDAQLEQASTVVDQLITIRESLIAVKKDFTAGRAKLKQALSSLRTATKLLGLAGITVPSKVDQALAGAEQVLQ